MKIADSSVPVVALKLFQHCGAGMMRSLGRLGIRVYGIDSNPRNPAFSSRYCRQKFVWNAEEEPGDKTISFLHEVAGKVGGLPILVVNGDILTHFVTEHVSELQDCFRFRVPSAQLARALSNKWEVLRLAKQYGISVPETRLPRSRREVDELLAGGLFRFPLMLKGADSALVQKRTGVRMVLARTEREALEKYDQLADPNEPDILLQEYIPGADDSIWMFDGYFNAQSDCLAGMVGRKLRQFPADTGMTSLGVLARNPGIEDSTRLFLKSVGYQGMVDIDYRFDARDGQYKLLDINPRIGATFRLFQDRHGLDVLRAYYLDLTGQPLAQGDVAEGRKWVVENNDLIALRQYRKNGKITVGKWLRSLRGVREAAWFAWDDPIPFLLMLRNFFLHLGRAITGRRPAESIEPKTSGLPTAQDPAS